MSSRKTFCLYHSDQMITNFCKDKHCLMPLCPSCIGQHSSFHQKNGSKPQYISIYEIICEVQNLVYDSISSLQSDKKRTAQLTKRINSVNELIRQKITQAKHLVHNILEQAFKQLQNDIKNNLAKMHDQIGLYSLKKTQKINQNIHQNLNQLYSVNQGLTSEKYLGYVIIFLKEKQKETHSFHTKSNENYIPKIDVSNQAVNSIVNSVSRMIKIQGKKDFERKREMVNNDKICVLKNKQNNKDYYQKSQKIERSYTPKRASIHYPKLISEAPKQSRPALITSNSAYTLGIQNTPTYAPVVSQRQKTYDQLQRRYSPIHQPLPSHLISNYVETSRFRDFKSQFDNLSKKISDIQKQNQLTVKARK